MSTFSIFHAKDGKEISKFVNFETAKNFMFKQMQLMSYSKFEVFIDYASFKMTISANKKLVLSMQESIKKAKQPRPVAPPKPDMRLIENRPPRPVAPPKPDMRLKENRPPRPSHPQKPQTFLHGRPPADGWYHTKERHMLDPSLKFLAGKVSRTGICMPKSEKTLVWPEFVYMFQDANNEILEAKRFIPKKYYEKYEAGQPYFDDKAAWEMDSYICNMAFRTLKEMEVPKGAAYFGIGRANQETGDFYFCGKRKLTENVVEK